MNAIKKVGYFSHQKSGCYLYRIKHPMDVLNNHGVPTHLIRLNEDVVLDDIQSIQIYGIFPFSFDYALKYIKSQGIKIVYDMDDALDFIDHSNPFYYAVKRDAFSEKEIFKYADHITVSTAVMADYVKEKTQAPITIVPNCYDPAEWTFPRLTRDGIRIGFAGSPTHVEDLLMVLPAIKNLQKKYDIRFLLFGFGPDTYEKWLQDFRFACTPEARVHLNLFEELMKEIKYEWVPFVDFEYFPSTLINMALDIGLCPLKNTPFNRSRSASKALEYNLAGAVALASDIPAYSQDPTSVLVKDDQWEIEIERCILDMDYTNEMKSRHINWIHEHRNINTQVDLLKSVYVV